MKMFQTFLRNIKLQIAILERNNRQFKHPGPGPLKMVGAKGDAQVFVGFMLDLQGNAKLFIHDSNWKELEAHQRT